MTAEPPNQGSSEQRSFRRFLEWLDDGADSGGQRYLEIRRRLSEYFARKNCIPADELADQTLSRVARRLEEEGSIQGATPAQYCYIVARFVFLEHQRAAKPVSLDGSTLSDSFAAFHENPDATTAHLNCLEECLGKLDRDQRSLILAYYQGEKRAKIAHRRALADRLGLSMNAISIRACRIRDRLQSCVKGCTASRQDEVLFQQRLT